MHKIFVHLLLISFLNGALHASDDNLNPEKNKSYRVLILWVGLGEYESAKRIELTCEKLGWVAKSTYCLDEIDEFHRYVIDTPVSADDIQEIADEFQPDLILSLAKERVFYSKVPNYLVLSGSTLDHFDTKFVENENLLDFDGFLSSGLNIKMLKNYVEQSGKTFHGIPWYLSCRATKYQPIRAHKLFCCGFQWDSKRNGKAFQKAFSLLDKKSYLVVYGPSDRWWFAPNSIRGMLPFDGKSICKAIKKAGIALVLHAPVHMSLGAPTARIFEAASSGSVIISDKNPFIVREFGNSVLYIDENISGFMLFQQINNHVKWIQSNPKKAENMARKAHEIFLKKFTLETQLKNLIRMHETIMQERAASL
jgi:glycosyltransferase involved in cell wall biosynthesis